MIDRCEQNASRHRFCPEGARTENGSDQRFYTERVTGIEPASPAWKAGALPLSYTREVRRLHPVGGGFRAGCCRRVDALE